MASVQKTYILNSESTVPMFYQVYDFDLNVSKHTRLCGLLTVDPVQQAWGGASPCAPVVQQYSELKNEGGREGGGSSGVWQIRSEEGG